MSDNRPSRLASHPEDIESKLNALIERFDSTAPRKPTEERVQTDSQADRDQFLDENKADIAKLSALLASKLSQQSDATGRSASDEQSDLAKLSSLLNNVLTKMDEPLPSDKENNGKSISILDLDPDRPLAEQQKEEKPKQNSALESLFANRAAALQPPKQTDVPLKLDPVFQKVRPLPISDCIILLQLNSPKFYHCASTSKCSRLECREILWCKL